MNLEEMGKNRGEDEGREEKIFDPLAAKRKRR